MSSVMTERYRAFLVAGGGGRAGGDQRPVNVAKSGRDQGTYGPGSALEVVDRPRRSPRWKATGACPNQTSPKRFWR